MKSAGNSSPRPPPATVKPRKPSLMDEHDLELEKVKLISLAVEFGFDEYSAKKCLDRLIELYGNPNSSFAFSNHLIFILL